MEGDKKRIPREREKDRETERKEDRKGGSEDKKRDTNNVAQI